jgi:strictosidine synthase-like protein
VRRHLAAAAAALALAAGCGDDSDEPAAATATPTPNPTVRQPPPEEPTPAPEGSAANAFIGSLAVDPADGTLFLGTGLGLYRVNAQGRGQRRVVGELSTPDGSGRLSSNLVVRFRAPGELLASGHPEGPGSLPENLGLLRSRDGGHTWESISELAEADFHLLQVSGDDVVGVHAEQTEIRVSADGGRTFEVRTPPARPVDVATDPRHAANLVVSTERGIFTSADGGGSWRQREPGTGSQLAWAASGELYRADEGGLVKASTDRGHSWEDRGTVDMTVNELAVDADGWLYGSVAGGEVKRSTDGGATWRRLVVLR